MTVSVESSTLSVQRRWTAAAAQVLRLSPSYGRYLMVGDWYGLGVQSYPTLNPKKVWTYPHRSDCGQHAKPAQSAKREDRCRWRLHTTPTAGAVLDRWRTSWHWTRAQQPIGQGAETGEGSQGSEIKKRKVDNHQSGRVVGSGGGRRSWPSVGAEPRKGGKGVSVAFVQSFYSGIDFACKAPRCRTSATA